MFICKGMQPRMHLVHCTAPCDRIPHRSLLTTQALMPLADNKSVAKLAVVRPKKRKRASSKLDKESTVMICANCGVTETPKWRCGESVASLLPPFPARVVAALKHRVP